MAATGVQLNWADVIFTPNGGAQITISRVTSLMFNRGGTLIKFAGDNARYQQVVANNMNDPTCSITSADVGLLFSLALHPGVAGMLTARQLDALTGSGIDTTGGEIDWKFGNNINTFAVVEGPDNTGAFSQFASGTINFSSSSNDGLTTPLTLTRV